MNRKKNRHERWNDHAFSKKDKRLLVLLVFGVLIILSDLGFSMSDGPVSTGHKWLELQGNKKQLYRIEENSSDSTVETIFPDPAGLPVRIRQSIVDHLREKNAVALADKQETWTVLSGVSPRLAFFLGQPFSINDAAVEDLVLVPGIGPALAASIIDYRQTKGPVTGVRGLTAINGIGPRMKKRLQHYFTFSVTNERE